MRAVVTIICFAMSLLASPAIDAQQTVKVGIILPYSGMLADTGAQLDGGIKLYVKEHGDTVAGMKIEFIRKDVGGIAPDVAERLAQELVTRDRADILAGFVLTPNALAAAEVSAKAKKLMVIMNAGTSIITTRSPYSTRTAVTLPQAAETLARWAFKSGIRKVYSIVADYGPGIDAEKAFHSAFKEAGGEIVGSVRFPVATLDFSPFVRRAKDVNPESIFVFMPAGSQPAAFAKSLKENGIDTRKTKILGTGDLTSEAALKSMGASGENITSAWNYDYNLKSKLNDDFVKKYNELNKRNPDFMSVGGYDGMHLIYEALKKTRGNTSGDALINAAKGLSWESPRGPILIDPETRDVVQTIYIRRTEMVGNELRNVTIDKVEKVKDPILERMRKAK
jgi:branched-chain amino acid transport system substrate-binding protein